MTKRIHHRYTGASPKAAMPYKKVMLGSIALVGCLTIVQLLLSNYFVSKGTDLAHILGEKEALSQENDILKVKLASLTSLTSISEQARQLGMVEAKNIVFVPEKPQSQPIAMQNTVLTQ